MYTFDQINDATGFANGEQFENEAEVQDYFTPDAMREMFGGNLDDYPVLSDADLLADMAETVLDNRWHCAF